MIHKTIMNNVVLQNRPALEKRRQKQHVPRLHRLRASSGSWTWASTFWAPRKHRRNITVSPAAFRFAYGDYTGDRLFATKSDFQLHMNQWSLSAFCEALEPKLRIELSVSLGVVIVSLTPLFVTLPIILGQSYPPLKSKHLFWTQPSDLTQSLVTFSAVD